VIERLLAECEELCGATDKMKSTTSAAEDLEKGKSERPDWMKRWLHAAAKRALVPGMSSQNSVWTL